MDEDPLLLWRLAPDLSVEDAAILIAGGDPSSMDPGPDFGDYVKRTYRHPGFAPAFSALTAAIRKGQLKARLAYRTDLVDPSRRYPWPLQDPKCWIVAPGDLGKILSDFDEDPFFEAIEARIEREPDWSRSMVDVDDLKAWMKSRGFSSGFFFPAAEGGPNDFLDETHDHFAPELALAVAVWRALANERTFPRGVRAAIDEWIERNLGAWQGEGPPSVNAKDRIATVVNWKQKGGAPKTGA